MNHEMQKYRHEMKYVISSAQLPVLKYRISQIMHLDPNVGEDGIYNIRSVYFDNYGNNCYFENENGTDPREKIRIRIYNHSSERITLECKRKDHGKTLKTSCLLSAGQAGRLLEGKPLDNMDLSSLQRKVNFQIHTQLLRPVVIVDYDRMPFVYRDGNVRVTFDANISSSSCVENFYSSDLSKRPIMPCGQLLMEVKFDEYLPDFIYQSLNLGQLQQSTFSKYYLCRKFQFTGDIL